MGILKQYIGLLLICLIGVTVFGQETVQDTFIVVKQFEPKLGDVREIKEHPEILDTHIVVPKLRYNVMKKQVPVSFEMEKVKPARIVGEPLVKLYNGYVKAGFGTNTTPLGEVYFNTKRSKVHNFGFYGKHFSSNGIAKLDYSDYSQNHAELFGKKFFNERHVLSARAYYDREKSHFYGIPDTLGFVSERKLAIKQLVNEAGASINLKRNFVDTAELNYSGTLDYHFFNDRYRVQENYFRLRGAGGMLMGMEHLHADFLFDFNRIDQGGAQVDRPSINPWMVEDQKQNSAILAISPRIRTNAKKWRIDAGLGMYLDMRDEVKFHFYPRAEFWVNPWSDVLVPYIGVYGELKRNRMAEVYRDNPFLNTQVFDSRNTNVKHDIYAGIRGSVNRYITFNVYAKKIMKVDMPFYVSDTTSSLGNTFDVIYDTLDQLAFGGELVYQNSERLKFALEANYYDNSTVNEMLAWHTPNFELKLASMYNIADKLIARFDVFVLGTQYAKGYEWKQNDLGVMKQEVVAQKLGTLTDFNLGFEYRYTKKLSAFINFNNIAAIRYQRYQRYPTQRLLILGGLTVAF